MKKAIIIIIVILIIAAFAIAVVKSKANKSDAAMIDTEKVERRNIESIVTAFGQVTPKTEVEISAKITGEIIALYVDEGDSVYRGDTLLQIDKGIYEAKVEQAEASLKSSEASLRQQIANLKKYQIDYERTKKMYEKGLVAKSELEQMETRFEVQKAVANSAENSVESARSHLDQSIEELSYTTIKSPQKGMVIGLTKEVGEYVIVGTMNNPGSVIMTIAQLDSMEVAVNVDETDIVELKDYQPVKISFDAIPDTSFAGEVRKIGNKAYVTQAGQDETIANFPVEIAILDVPNGIRSGMSVTAEIITETADSALTVPIQAVVTGKTQAEIERQRQGNFSFGRKQEDEEEPNTLDTKNAEEQEFVFLFDSGEARKVPVETGIADANYIEIKSGIDADDLVIKGPYKELRRLYDGKPVQKSQENALGKKNGKSVTIKLGK